MNQQIELFKEVRKRYPKHTYKKFSELFEIPQTRLFRVMNGAELRTSEYFKIKQVMGSEESEISKLITFLESHSMSLNRNDCRLIVSELKNKILIRNLMAR